MAVRPVLAALALLPVVGGALLMVVDPPSPEFGCSQPLVHATLEHLARCDHGARVRVSSTDMMSGHHPIFLTDGRVGGEVEKWVSFDGDDAPTVTLHLPAPASVGRVIIHHAGARERSGWTAQEFSILVEEEGAFQEVEHVRDNSAPVSTHTFPARMTAAVRLVFHKPARNGDRHARIYEVELHGP